MEKHFSNKDLLVLCNDILQNENKYVSFCFNTMKDLFNNWKLVSNSEDESAIILERNYILSLVFLMGKNAKDTSFGINVFPSGENNKNINIILNEMQKTYKDVYSKELKRPYVVIPDLVIHNSHDIHAIRSTEQYVAVEAKTTKRLGTNSFYKDFFKLNVYLSSLSFKAVVYLIINTKKKAIEKMIEKYFSEYYFKSEKLEQIYFFIQENKDDCPKAYKIGEKYIMDILKKYELKEKTKCYCK